MEKEQLKRKRHSMHEDARRAQAAIDEARAKRNAKTAPLFAAVKALKAARLEHPERREAIGEEIRKLLTQLEHIVNQDSQETSEKWRASATS